MEARARLVVVGNGMAGARLVEDLLAAAPGRFAITVIGAEAGGSYNRILLSAVLAGDRERHDIVTHDAAWYAARGVLLRSAETATAIDRTEGLVRTDRDAAVPYDLLVLATGSTPVMLPIPGADLAGVVAFRDLADVERMIAAAAAGTRAIVIGGGLLGLEAADGLRRRGMAVTVVHLMPWIMERQLDRRAADMLKASLIRRGIRFVMPAETAAILGRGRATGIRLGDGRTLPADLVVMGVGIRANTALALAAGLDCRKGVVVDDRLQTSDPRIYALGECIEHQGRVYGLVGPIWEQSRILAKHLAGVRDAAYRGSIATASLKIAGIDTYSLGDLDATDGAEEILLDDAARGVYRKLVLSAGRLQGAVLYGDISDAGWYAELVRQNRPIEAWRHDLIFGRQLAERGGRGGGDERPAAALPMAAAVP